MYISICAIVLEEPICGIAKVKDKKESRGIQKDGVSYQTTNVLECDRQGKYDIFDMVIFNYTEKFPKPCANVVVHQTSYRTQSS